MFSLFKRKQNDIEALYHQIIDQSRQIVLYDTYGVPDTPFGRFHMIMLHASPHFKKFVKREDQKSSQALFDLIFRDVELSLRELGVGDLSVPKKMKRYMTDCHGLVQAHSQKGANHAEITRRNVFGEDNEMSSNFKTYIRNLFQEECDEV
jgi:cytochrome b pre-mRNA-processing protein 3